MYPGINPVRSGRYGRKVTDPGDTGSDAEERHGGKHSIAAVVCDRASGDSTGKAIGMASPRRPEFTWQNIEEHCKSRSSAIVDGWAASGAATRFSADSAKPVVRSPDTSAEVVDSSGLQPHVAGTPSGTPRHRRPDAEWVGKVIARIGKKAGIIVEPADERTGRPVKFATAHDLRRSCGERLRNAGVPPLVICRVMRTFILGNHSEALRPRRHSAGCGSPSGHSGVRYSARTARLTCTHFFMGTLRRKQSEPLDVSRCGSKYTPLGSNQ